jgi:hypothetical protein
MRRIFAGTVRGPGHDSDAESTRFPHRVSGAASGHAAIHSAAFEPGCYQQKSARAMRAAGFGRFPRSFVYPEIDRPRKRCQ